MNVGDKIRKIREIKDLKQDYVAARLGMSVTAYGNIERNESKLSLERLEEIAAIFEMKPEDILTFDEKYVFHNYGEIKGQYGSHNTQICFPEEMKKLYEENSKLQADMIKLLQEKITYLEGKK